MSTLQRRPNREGGTFYIYFYDVNGVKVGKSLGTKSIAEALRMQAELDNRLAEEKAAAGKPVLERDLSRRFWGREFRGERPEIALFTEVVLPELLQGKSPNTFNSYQATWKRFVRSIELRYMDEIDAKAVEKFAKSIEEAGTSPSALDQYLVVIRVILNLAIQTGWFTGPNPIDLPGLRRGRFMAPAERGYCIPNADQVSTILATARNMSPRMEMMVGLAPLVGLRKNEIMHLDWRDIGFQARQIRIVNSPIRLQREPSRSEVVRTVPLRDDLARILSRHSKNVGFVIEPRRGEHLRRYNAILNKDFKRIQEESGIRFTLATLRESFVRRAVEAGISLVTVARWTGYTDIKKVEEICGDLIRKGEEEDVNRFE